MGTTAPARTQTTTAQASQAGRPHCAHGTCVGMASCFRVRSMAVRVTRSILYVANAAKIGGGNRVLMDMMQGLDRERYAPILVAPDGGPLTEWARDSGIPCHVVKASG